MNKLPSNENICVVKTDKEVCLVVDYNYELWECIVNLEEYRCYGCEDSQDLEALLTKSVKSPDSANVLFTFCEEELQLDFIIDLGFKKISKQIDIPKIRQMTEVEKLELYVEDKLAAKDSEIKILQEKLEEQKSTIDRLSQFLDYVVIGNSMVSISQTKKLKICGYDCFRNGGSDQCITEIEGYDDSLGFTVVVLPPDWTLLNTANISNIKYLQNIEALVIIDMNRGTVYEISDLSFLELPTLKALRVRGVTYTGKALFIPNLVRNLNNLPIRKE